ncbi:RadC family protein [Beggiatoa leptomitoformis]|uniref:DNA repair protein RadC n=1 Tax=Beggiatoa leptomitoformis TaxID=288004 RepID=A0A2N9YGS4_9GAMM|nr:DNA repair protein RadC [Beggiatoa leptomitoformis]ALG68118.1 DNA repair protein RadC [Beggiatoa leptomitoformis]AUI69585.1 DNA repair protein RadC [Beggiatoa leptomitoformis]
MSIKDWDEENRPREKLLQKGAQALTDAELLAIFLRTGVKGKSALDLAQALLKEFGDLRSLLGAKIGRFCQANGLGTVKYVQLQACLELSKRYLSQCLQRGDVMSDPEITRNYLLTAIGGNPQEVFACLFLDSKNRVIRFDEMFFGTVDSANIYPREVMRKALEHNAAAVIFAHNHPSGVAEPSHADITITHRLKEVLEFIDVRVLDHIVIGDGYSVSLAERGLM